MLFRARGTWELTDGGIVWHTDRARSQARDGYWAALGEERIKADTNPILEVGASRPAYHCGIGGMV